MRLRISSLREQLNAVFSGSEIDDAIEQYSAKEGLSKI